MERLVFIGLINPEWYKQINDFLEENPTYKKLIPIVAVDQHPNGFNPSDVDEFSPTNIFETMLHGLAFAEESNIDYPAYQYRILVTYLRKTKLTKDMDFPPEISERKVRTYRELINTILDNGIEANDFKYQDFHLVENIYGMSESTITLIHLLHDELTSDRCIPYGNKQFVNGIMMFYKLDTPPTLEFMKEVTSKWTNKKVGLMFIVQCAHFGQYI